MDKQSSGYLLSKCRKIYFVRLSPFFVIHSFLSRLFSPVQTQIYIFYGTRSNAEFVIHNGFFFENNAHDRVKIKLGVSKSDRLYAMKAEVLARAGIPT